MNQAHRSKAPGPDATGLSKSAVQGAIRREADAGLRAYLASRAA
jgi:hypothetical protein